MRRAVLAGTALMLGLCVTVAGCGAGSSSSSSGERSTTTRPPGASASTTTTSPGGPTNLAVTDELRTELVAAGASLNNIPASEYSGLEPGLTYYAYYPVTATYWAGAKLVGATMRAQVSTQDDGAYLLFHRSGNGSWIAQNVGLAGGTLEPCPTGTPPPTIVALWGWQAGTCKPRL
jgi:hypothetical protein